MNNFEKNLGGKSIWCHVEWYLYVILNKVPSPVHHNLSTSRDLLMRGSDVISQHSRPSSGILQHAVHCTALHCTGLRWTLLHCIALYCSALHCNALHSTALNCTALHHTALHWNALHCTAMDCLAFTAPQCTALNCTALFPSALHPTPSTGHGRWHHQTGTLGS